MNINIVMDNKNNWFYKRVPSLIKSIEKMGHKCKLLLNQKAIPANSDISFFLGHEGYVGRATRRKSKYNIVVHASDLPKGRGMSPTTWQILEGKNKIPVTLFEVVEDIDAGDYYLKDSFKLNGSELINEWQEKLGQCIEQITLNFIKNIKKLKPIKQKGKATVYKWRTPEDSELNINRSIKSQLNLLRVVDNERYPAFFKYKNCKYILKIYKKNDS